MPPRGMVGTPFTARREALPRRSVAGSVHWSKGVKRALRKLFAGETKHLKNASPHPKKQKLFSGII
eukprot:5586864-Prorocentrum_lima.AAC.1